MIYALISTPGNFFKLNFIYFERERKREREAEREGDRIPSRDCAVSTELD